MQHYTSYISIPVFKTLHFDIESEILKEYNFYNLGTVLFIGFILGFFTFCIPSILGGVGMDNLIISIGSGLSGMSASWSFYVLDKKRNQKIKKLTDISGSTQLVVVLVRVLITRIAKTVIKKTSKQVTQSGQNLLYQDTTFTADVSASKSWKRVDKLKRK